MRDEQWVAVDSFPDYDVSRDGKVRNAQTGRWMRPSMNQFGVVRVTIIDGDGVQHQKSLALIVAKAWVPIPSNPSFNTPINLDGNRWNCAAWNLEWRPRWFALQYHKQFEHPPEYPHPLQDLGTGKVYENSRVVAMSHGLLEKDLLAAIMSRTYAYPTFQIFVPVD